MAGRAQARMPRGRARVGCSGWQYKHWRGDFYPPDLPQAKWFEHYAARFDTVEINNSFYRLPPPETFDKWRKQAPDGFCYAVKANSALAILRLLAQRGAGFDIVSGGELRRVLAAAPEAAEPVEGNPVIACPIVRAREPDA